MKALGARAPELIKADPLLAPTSQLSINLENTGGPLGSPFSSFSSKKASKLKIIFPSTSSAREEVFHGGLFPDCPSVFFFIFMSPRSVEAAPLVCTLPPSFGRRNGQGDGRKKGKTAVARALGLFCHCSRVTRSLDTLFTVLLIQDLAMVFVLILFNKYFASTVV